MTYSWKPPPGAKIQQIEHHCAAYQEHLKEQATESSHQVQVKQYTPFSCNKYTLSQMGAADLEALGNTSSCKNPSLPMHILLVSSCCYRHIPSVQSHVFIPPTNRIVVVTPHYSWKVKTNNQRVSRLIKAKTSELSKSLAGHMYSGLKNPCNVWEFWTECNAALVRVEISLSDSEVK